MAETVAEFAKRMRQLEALACPTPADIPFSNRHIQTVTTLGATYKDALEHVIRMRSNGGD